MFKQKSTATADTADKGKI